MSPGIQVEQFVDDVNPDFVCSICYLVLLCPVSTPCDHHFCEFCIRKWLKVGYNSCPTCRSSLAVNELKPMSRIIVNILGNLRLRCPNNITGCNEIITYNNLESHEDICKYDSTKFIICRKCGIRLKNDEIDDHTKICMMELYKENQALLHHIDKLKFHKNIFVSLSIFFLFISLTLLLKINIS